MSSFDVELLDDQHQHIHCCAHIKHRSAHAPSATCITGKGIIDKNAK